MVVIPKLLFQGGEACLLSRKKPVFGNQASDQLSRGDIKGIIGGGTGFGADQDTGRSILIQTVNILYFIRITLLDGDIINTVSNIPVKSTRSIISLSGMDVLARMFNVARAMLV